MRQAVLFCILLLAEMSIYLLRATYSFSKFYLEQDLALTRVQLGLVDMCFILSRGFSNFHIARSPPRNPRLDVSLSLFLIGLNFLTLWHVLGQDWEQGLDSWLIEFYLLSLMCINGVLQAHVYPNLIRIFQQNFQKESILLGVWLTSGGLGNIIGFYWSSKTNQTQGWLKSYQTFAIATSLSGLLCLYLPWKQEELSLQTVQSPPLKQYLRPLNLLYLISYSLVKSIMSGVTLWLPLFFAHQGYAQFRVLIFVLFQIFSVGGTIVVNRLLSISANKSALLNGLVGIILVDFLAIKYFKMNITSYAVLVSLAGFCLGGSGNSLKAMISFGKNKSMSNQKVVYFSALTDAVSDFVAACTQLMIGMLVSLQQQYVFLFFVCCSAVCAGSLLLGKTIQMMQIGGFRLV